MHRRPRLSLAVVAVASGLVVAVAVTALVLVAGRVRDRPLDVRAAPKAQDPVCARLGAALPSTLQGRARTPTTSSSPAVAAWGRPAVIWRCGVTPPGPTTDPCLTVDGVDWVQSPLADGVSFTTFGRSPAVQVLVPRADAPEAMALPPLSAVVRPLPQGEDRCR